MDVRMIWKKSLRVRRELDRLGWPAGPIKVGACLKATGKLLLRDKTAGQCLTFIPLSQFSPTAPPPLATQCDFHLFFTAHSLSPSMKRRSMCWTCLLGSLGLEHKYIVKSFLHEMAPWVTNWRSHFTLMTFWTKHYWKITSSFYTVKATGENTQVRSRSHKKWPLKL